MDLLKPSRGLRQGGPLSLFFFKLAVDALATILDVVKRGGHLRGVVSHLIGGGGISHLQYVNNKILMFKATQLDIINLKFLLLCFEEMSGLAINFSKSEVLAMGYYDHERF